MPKTNDPYTTNVARKTAPSLPDDVVVLVVVLDCSSHRSDDKKLSSSLSLLL